MGRRYLNEEQKAKFREKRNQTMMKKYGVKSFTNVEKVKQTKKERYGDENYNNQEKHKQTCLEKYGVEHHNQNKEIAKKISEAKLLPETQSKYEKTMIEKYGASTPNLVPELRKKWGTTLMQNYGVKNPLQNEEIKQKHYETMRLNKTFNTSKPEENYYLQLVEQYGEDDVERQYKKDERYPFACDFHIKSTDEFIELNFHPTHGSHPFNSNNPEDLVLLEQLIEDDTEWSRKIIDIWTQKDVIKLQTAIKNKLKYKMIYPE